jgi:hypothetical protein
MNDINGLRLPDAVSKAMETGCWTAEGKAWHAVFPPDEVQGPMLYSLSLMRRVNLTWLHETRDIFLGVANGRSVPGILDPSQSLLIGEVAGDAMIALNYRIGKAGPSVAFLSGADQWVQVAENFDDFWTRLSFPQP